MDLPVKGRSKIGKSTKGAVPTGPAAARGSKGAGKGGKNGIISAGAQRAILRSAGSSDVSMREPRAPRGGLVELSVGGWKENTNSSQNDGGEKSLRQWLEKKARMRLGRTGRDEVRPIRKSRIDADGSMIICVPEVEARAYEKMNGYKWAGTTLRITRLGEAAKQEAKGLSSAAEETKAMLRGVLERRWNPDTKILDLSVLAQDPDLQNAQMFSQGSTASKFFPALMVVLEKSFSEPKERDEAIQAVSLAGNDLGDLKIVSTLSETLPNLQNLDLSNNKFETVASLHIWRRRFRHLQHLILTNNPLEQTEPNYATEIMSWYPNLMMLNNVQVRTAEDIANKKSASNLPFPVRAPQFNDEGGIAEGFIRNWFAGFDNDRAQLAQVYYDENSDFSFAVNISAPRDPSGSENTVKQEWAAYIPHSRNLRKVTQLPARQKRIFHGTQAIAEAFASMPATKHPDLADSSKWMIEANIQPGIPDPTGNAPSGVDGFYISIHGEFEEAETNRKRSMDHAIYIGPGGSLGVRVISHKITLRAYGGTQAFQVTASTPPMPAAEPVAAEGVPGLPAGLTMEVAERMVTELTKQTGMTIESSQDCLMQTAWNFDAALSAFQSVKASLPPTAFINGVVPA